MEAQLPKKTPGPAELSKLEREEESAPSLSIPPWFPLHLEETARSMHRQAFDMNGDIEVNRGQFMALTP